MRQLFYVLQFRGSFGPVDGVQGMIRAATSAAACRVTTALAQCGIRGRFEEVNGPMATFESEVTMTGDTTFLGSGLIRFGENSRLAFSTVGDGHLAPSPEAGWLAGAVTWRVDLGEGQLAGASGLITSNFQVGPSGEVVDNHLGVIYLP